MVTWTKDFNRHFKKEKIEMSKMHMKMYSTSLVIGKSQIETTRKCNYTPMEWLNYFLEIDNTKCWRKYGAFEILIYCWWKCIKEDIFWIPVWQTLKK